MWWGCLAQNSQNSRNFFSRSTQFPKFFLSLYSVPKCRNCDFFLREFCARS